MSYNIWLRVKSSEGEVSIDTADPRQCSAGMANVVKPDELLYEHERFCL